MSILGAIALIAVAWAVLYVASLPIFQSNIRDQRKDENK